MITETTTLILGAGASNPYGFPTGHELRQLLCDPNSIIGVQKGFPGDAVKTFSAAFLQSGMSSIDAFLARRGDHKVGRHGATFSEVGKDAIAYCLIQRERAESLHAFPEDHWYQYLWSFLADSLDSFGDNKLRIITFNYDRSLEYYLLTSLQHSFGITSHEAAQHLKKIPILHAYGQLAVLPELAVEGQESRYYRPDVSDPAYIAAAARGIRVIDESRDDDEVFDQAFSYLKESRKICFLGFGFDETNMRRLRVAELMNYFQRERRNDLPVIFATTSGKEEAERRKIIYRLSPEKLGPEFNPAYKKIEPYGHMRITQYLRASGALL